MTSFALDAPRVFIFWMDHLDNLYGSVQVAHGAIDAGAACPFCESAYIAMLGCTIRGLDECCSVTQTVHFISYL